MLQPFRVGNLKTHAEASDNPNAQVVCLSAPTYDETISGNSRATLKYNDEEGDVITVGSSIELAQKLSETPQNIKPDGSNTTNTIAPQNLHEFNIEEKEDVQKVWQTLHHQSVGRYMPLARGTSSKQSDVDHTVGRNGEDTGTHWDKYRKHYFNMTDPPNPKPIATKAWKETNRQTAMAEPTMSSSNLTPEGQRQAQSAGEKLRARDSIPRSGIVTETTSKRIDDHNRWASYQPQVLRASIPALDSQIPGTEPKTDLPTDTHTGQDRARISRLKKMEQPSRVANNYVKSEPSDSNEDDISQIIPMDPDLKTQPITDASHGRKQSLLQVFEAEMAKPPVFNIDVDKMSPFSTSSEPNSTRNTRAEGQLEPEARTREDTSTFPASDSRKGDQIVDTKFQSSTEVNPQSLELGILRAVEGFESCLRGLVDVLNATQPGRKGDPNLVKEALHTVQNYAGELVSREVSNTNAKRVTVDRGANPRSPFGNANSHSQETGPAKVSFKISKPTSLERLAHPVKDASASEATILAQAGPKRNQVRFVHEVHTKSERPVSDMSASGQTYGSGSARVSYNDAQREVTPVTTHIQASPPLRTLRHYQSTGALGKPKLTSCKAQPEYVPQSSGRGQCAHNAASEVTSRFPTIAQLEKTEFLNQDPQPPLIDFNEDFDPAIHGPWSDPLRPEEQRPSDSKDAAPAVAKAKLTQMPSSEVNGLRRRDTSQAASSIYSPGQLPTLRRPVSLNLHHRHRLAEELPNPRFADLRPPVDASKVDTVPPTLGRVEKHNAKHGPVPNPLPTRQTAQSSEPGTAGKGNMDSNNYPRGVERFSTLHPKLLQNSTSVNGARLTGPFNAHEFSPSLRGASDGVRRSATIAGLQREASYNRRRPYSEHYSGSGRSSWDAFVQPTPDSQRISSAPRTTEVTAATVDSKLDAVKPKSESTLRDLASAQQDFGPHSWTASIQPDAIRQCVRQLIELGFDRLDRSRLRMYAEATGGDLDASLDMISEDEQAQRGYSYF